MWYALASYRAGNGSKPAVVLGEELYDLSAAWLLLHPNEKTCPTWAGSVDAVLRECPPAQLDALVRSLAEAVAAGRLSAVEGGADNLLAPLRPPRIFGTASNYIEHAAEMNTLLAAKADSSPYIFLKASTSVIGTGQTVMIPPETEKPDWEVELGVVIGRGGRRIRAADALEHIAGYTIVNDVSARDMNRRTDYPFKHDWFRGKSWDTFCPMGPWVVPRSCIPDLHNLPLRLWVNGEQMQDGNTSELIWNVFEQIEYLSSILTLQSGDVIMTGTPAGVGMGRGVFLRPGDVMTASIEGIGAITNPVAAEPVNEAGERA
jgi:2-keto-4-pentenoate hydratase/2-oxohepta-3-ene-1,7-dioic acid hydratase in catechol pathway